MALLKGSKPAVTNAPPAVWAAFAAQGRWKNWLLLGQFLVILLLILTNFAAFTRPPDVVLVEPDGKGTFVSASVQTSALARWVADQKQLPSDLTILRFAREFLHAALAINSSTIEATWPQTLSMMAPQLRDQTAKEATEKKLVEGYQALRIQTDLAIEDLLLVERTDALIHIRAKLARTKRPLMVPGAAGATDRMAVDLVLRVLPRSPSRPDGLEVAQWSVSSEPEVRDAAANR